MSDIKKQVDSALVEYFATIAKRDEYKKDGPENAGVWAGHAGIYVRSRAWLTAALAENIDLGLTCMFDSKDDLEFDVQYNYTVVPLDKSGRAAVLKGTGVRHGQIWVEGSSDTYRDAMLSFWKQFGEAPTTRLHSDAVRVFEEVIDGVEKEVLRSKLTSSERSAIVRELEQHRDAHRSAARSGPEPRLFDIFDCTMDADHVFSSSAVRNVPGAWLLLFPVPAAANRGFGSKVESKFLKLKEESSARNIASEMLFKLFAGFMPTDSGEMTIALRRVYAQLDVEVRERHMQRIECVMSRVLGLEPTSEWHDFKRRTDAPKISL